VGNAVEAGIESGRWYRVRLEKRGAELIGSLDGRVVETLREEGAPSLASSAGVDTSRRELVLKLVNGARERTLELRGLPLSRQWKGEILTADSLMAENTRTDGGEHPGPTEPGDPPALASAGGDFCNFAAAITGGGAYPAHAR